MAKRAKMIFAVPENTLSHKQLLRIEFQAKYLYRQHFGKHWQTMPLWITVPAGQFFNAGKPAQISTVSITVPNQTPNSVRHEFMSRFSEMWITATNCKENQLVLSVIDETLSTAFGKSHLQRIRPSARMYYVSKILLQMMKSKISQGFMSINLNLKP